MYFIDIIILGVIATLLALKLRSVLGEREADAQSPKKDHPFADRPDQAAEDGQESDTKAPPAKQDPIIARALKDDPDDRTAQALVEISIADPSFDTREFLDRACQAFEMILTRYADGQDEQLKPLLARPVFQRFKDDIEHRRQNNRQMHLDVHDIHRADIHSAKVDGDRGSITVDFESTQTRYITDADDQVVEGDEDRPRRMKDRWTFSRDLASDDPTWTLTQTDGRG
jgi:predicted lipid-binding transport protein (Tim44 family)